MAKNRYNLQEVISGGADGELIVWNLMEQKSSFTINAHKNFVRGLSYANNKLLSADTFFISTGDDNKVNIWSLNYLKEQYATNNSINNFKNYQSKASYGSRHMMQGLDHSYTDDLFATGGPIVQIWNYERSSPIQSFEWGVDTVTKVKFNPSESNLIASVAMDRSVCLYDIRGNSTLQKVYMKNRSNAICWNPQEPMNFVIVRIKSILIDIQGNENSNCYTFDMRKLDQAKLIHKDHIQAVLDIDFAPTGREFVTGSFDKTIRIFAFDEGRSREVYHTKRMQQ